MSSIQPSITPVADESEKNADPSQLSEKMQSLLQETAETAAESFKKDYVLRSRGFHPIDPRIEKELEAHRFRARNFNGDPRSLPYEERQKVEAAQAKRERKKQKRIGQ